MAEDDDEGFGDFIFAPRSSSHGGTQIKSNGFFTNPQSPQPPGDDDDDDTWGDFVAQPSRSQPTPNFTSFQFNLSPSNGFFPNPPSQPVQFGFDPFGLSDSSSSRPAESQSQSIGVDSDSVSKRVGIEKPRGPLPLSFFGEEEEEDGGEEGDRGGSVGNLPANVSNGFWHPKPYGTVVNVAYSNLKASTHDILANLYAQSQPIKSENEMDLNSKGLGSVSKADPDAAGRTSGFDDEDVWEFQGAFSENGNRVTNFKEQGGSELSGHEGELIGVISENHKAGQDMFKFVENNNLGSKNATHEFVDLFTAQNGVNDKKGEVNVRSDVKATAVFQNGFLSFPLATDVEVGKANGTYDTTENTHDCSDDFGEFMDAASEPGLKPQEDETTAHDTPAKAHMHDRNIVDHSTRHETHRQPLPVYIFSDGVVVSDDIDKNVLTDGPNFTHKKGINSQGSVKSIHDIISDLYDQVQHVSSVDSSREPARNGLHPIQKMFDSSTLSVQTYFGNNSWDFKGAGVKENSSVSEPNDVIQISSVTLSDLQTYVDFCARLRDRLCFLASCLLDDAEKTQISVAVNGEDEKAVVSNSKIQEARKILQDNMETEVQIDKNMSVDGCLNEFLEILREQKFQIAESEYHLSKRLPLAEKDWVVAVELLKETRLVEKILTSASANEQSAFISAWSKMVDASVEELRHGALIWKQAIGKNLQISILSDPRGQQYIQALGEIYRVVQLLWMSTKVYKPWMLLRKGDQSRFSLTFDECSALWSNSGLEEAYWNWLGSFDSRSGKTFEASLESVKHIQEIDVFFVQDSVFHQQNSICQLTLLPENMLPDLKMVSWNEEKYFLSVANLWANLISHNPPSLPHLNIF